MSGGMDPKQRADLHERVADVEHDTEARVHSVADIAPKAEHLHDRASRISARARDRQRRAAELRRRGNEDAP